MCTLKKIFGGGYGQYKKNVASVIEEHKERVLKKKRSAYIKELKKELKEVHDEKQK